MATAIHTPPPTAEALAAYRRCVEQLAAGDDVDLTSAIAICHAAGQTSVDLSDAVAVLAEQMATDGSGS